MHNLAENKCTPCSGEVSPLNRSELKDFQSQLHEEWNLKADKSIQRIYEFEGFPQAIEFVNQVAEIAESEGHHPDIYIKFSKVLIELSTHSINGLSENDFILAAKIDELKS